MALKEENDLFKEKIGGSAILRRKSKIELPEKFDGNRWRFQGYVIEMKNYFMYYVEEFLLLVDRIRYAVSCFTRDATCWFEPKLYDYLDNATGERDDNVIAIFSLWDKYVMELQAVFDDPDKDKSIRVELSRFRQTMSINEYVSRFRQVTMILG